jgi:nucleoside-diphosphate-sugar epimerase
VTNKVVITGASGLVGTASLEKFLGEGWDVVAVSRRKPEVRSRRPFQHVAVDLRDEAAGREALGALSGVTHVVYAAVYEKPDLVAGWHDRDQMETNETMLRNTVEPLAAAGALRHVSILQGTKAYGVHLHPIPIPARERDPRDDHENYMFRQEDYLRAAAGRHGFAYTVWRPQVVIGPNVGVELNIIPAIGAYAAIAREEGLPFSFPGGPSFVWEAVDVRLLADALAWAATAPQAADETFNITNGDVFEWRNLWPALAETLGVETGPDRPLPLTSYLPEKAGVWDKVVAKYDLRPLSLDRVIGKAHQHADFAFAYGAEAGPRAFVSTIKLRQAGFTEVMDTEDSFRHWLQDLIDRRILPPAAS